jgi:hypothetical protein
MGIAEHEQYQRNSGEHDLDDQAVGKHLARFDRYFLNGADGHSQLGAHSPALSIPIGLPVPHSRQPHAQIGRAYILERMLPSLRWPIAIASDTFINALALRL